MAKTSRDVKNYSLVPAKPSSPRDSHPDDLDTVLVVSSEEISRARAEAESLTSETATVDRHPIILDDSEEDTDRFAGKDGTSSGLVKNPLKAKSAKAEMEEEEEPETATFSLKEPLPTLLDDDLPLEISASGLQSDPGTGTGDASPKGAGPAPSPRASLSEESTAPKEKIPRFDDETKPIPKPDLAAVGAVLETVPLEAGLVQNVLAQVDARAAARAAGKPVPQFQLPTGPPMPVAQQPPLQVAPTVHPRTQAPTYTKPAPSTPVAAPRRLGVEILITLLAFLFVAVPALYYLYVNYRPR